MRETSYLRQAESMLYAAEEENRYLTTREGEQFDRLMAFHENAVGRGSGRYSVPGMVGGSKGDPTWGFTPAEYFRSVMLAHSGGASAPKAHQRIVAAATTYGSEGIGQDGGFAVPPDFQSRILQKVTGETSLFSLCDKIPTSGSALIVPKDERAPWDNSGGIKSFWDGEASIYTQSKPDLQKSTIPVHKLTAMVPVTDELLEDAPAVAAYVLGKGAEVIDQRISDAIVDGTGAGMPLGILRAPCMVTQAAEASQVADTIHGKNLVKMYARMPARWRARAVWLIHGDAEQELMQAGLQIFAASGGTATGGQLVYAPAGTISNQPYSTLFGRPVIQHQSCKPLGDVGDIIFASLPQYAAVLKGAGLRTDVSIHVYFDQGITAFRFTFRMGGQPWWSAPITDKNGSTTRGPFVTLAAR